MKLIELLGGTPAAWRLGGADSKERAKRKERIEKEILALDDFLANACYDKSLSVNEARKNLENGILELRYRELGGYDAGHSGNGLLITPDGYFLTARHCVDSKRVLTSRFAGMIDGKRYRVREVCCWSRYEEDDLALARIEIKEPYKAFSYRVSAEKRIALDTSVVMLARREGKLDANEGCVTSNRNPFLTKINPRKIYNYPHHFVTDTPVRAGDSGGVIAGIDGVILGIVSSGYREAGVGYHTSCARFFRAIELVEKYLAVLRRSL